MTNTPIKERQAADAVSRIASLAERASRGDRDAIAILAGFNEHESDKWATQLDPHTPKQFFGRPGGSEHATRASKAKDRLHAITGTPEYEDAFFQYLESNGKYVPAALTGANREYQSMSIVSDTNGGFLFPAQHMDEILAQMPANSEILSLVRTVETDAASVEWPRVVPNSTSGYEDIYTSAGVGSMVGEVPAAADGNNEQVFGMFRIDLKRARYIAKVGMDMLQDRPQLSSFLLGDASQNLALLAESELLVGSGVGNHVSGIMKNPDITQVDIAGTTSHTISNSTTDRGSVDKIMALIYAVPAQYRRSPSFRTIMKSASELAIRKLVDGVNRPVWSADGLLGSSDSGLLNRPTAISEFMDSDGVANNMPLLCGDLSQLIFAPRSEIRVQILDQRYADNDQVGLIVRWRFGAGTFNPRAFRIGYVS